MAAYINTNIASLNAQRNLTASQGALQTSLQRLSSGLRINSAKDDAAGLAISSRFTTQIKGLDQAVRNANDGISLAQTGEGALTEVTNNLQRIRELAVQAANSTNSADDRAAIDLEVQQRLAEIDRTASQTAFNGQKILDGSFGSAGFQIGANAGETITVGLSTSVRTADMGAAASVNSGVALSTLMNSATTAAVAGAYDKAAVSSYDFRNISAAAANYTSGTAFTGNFSTVTGTASVYTAGAAAVTDYSTVAGTASVYTSESVTPTDYSGAGSVTFDITGGSGTGSITLNTNITSDADMVAALNDGGANAAALAAAGVSVALTGGVAVFTSTDTSTATDISFDATGEGIFNNGGTAGVSTPAVADDTSANATFQITGPDGTATINLSTNVTDNDSLLAALNDGGANQAALTAAGITASNSANGVISFTSTSTDTATDISLDAAGTTILGGAIATNAVADDASANKTFTVTGTGSAATINIASNITDAASMLAAINDGGANQAALTAAGITASTDGTTIKFATAAGAGNVTIGGADAALITGTGGAATAGIAAEDRTASFDVDGLTVDLTANDTNQAGLVSDIQGQLNTLAPNTYTVTASGTGFKIASSVAGTTTPTVVDNFTGANAAMVSGGTSTTAAAAIPAATLTLDDGDLSIQIGNGNAVDIKGTFTDSTQLVNAINSSVQGVFATVDNAGKLKLTSSQDITLAGANTGASATELAFATTTNAAAGNLSTANVKTVAGANDIIQRVDNALSTVSTLRSTFGAVQNRFESVISNLSSTSENLSAARSRIQDADFAAETASLTRGQILQQAGTAMLAQANSLPNGVLALLR